MNVLTDLADGARKLQEIGKRIDQADLREEIVSQRELLLDARDAISDLRDENATLIGSLEKMRSSKSRLESLTEVDGFHYDKSKGEAPIGLPYCPACIERGDGFFRLVQANGQGRPHQCPGCKFLFLRVQYHAARD